MRPHGVLAFWLARSRVSITSSVACQCRVIHTLLPQNSVSIERNGRYSRAFLVRFLFLLDGNSFYSLPNAGLLAHVQQQLSWRSLWPVKTGHIWTLRVWWRIKMKCHILAKECLVRVKLFCIVLTCLVLSCPSQHCRCELLFISWQRNAWYGQLFCHVLTWLILSCTSGHCRRELFLFQRNKTKTPFLSVNWPFFNWLTADRYWGATAPPAPLWLRHWIKTNK